MDWEGPFEPEGGSVAAARRCAQRYFTRVTRRSLSDVSLVVSELATNAVVHARTEFTVGFHLGGGRARVEVRDHAPGLPDNHSLALSTSNGRGLLIVATLAEQWGVEWGPATKTVWAELSVLLEPARSRNLF